MIEDNTRRIPKRRSYTFRYIFLGILIIIMIGTIYVENESISGIIAIFWVVLLIGAIVYGIYNQQKWRKVWEGLGQSTGLTLSQVSTGLFSRAPTLSGFYRGYPLKMQIIARGSGRSRRHYTQIIISLNQPFLDEIKVTKKNIFSKAASMLQSLDPEKAHPVFDEAIMRLYTIKGDTQNVLARAFTYTGLRQGMIELHDTARSIKLVIADRQLFYEEHGQMDQLDYMEAVLDLMTELARAIDRP
jgi:hypothetical protein